MLSEKEFEVKGKVIENLANKINEELIKDSSLQTQSTLPDLIKSFAELLKAS